VTEIYMKTCNAVLRGLQFGWKEFEGRRIEQLVGRFEMLDGEDQGRFETWFASLSEDHNSKGKPFIDFTVEALRACGWTEDDWMALPDLAESGQLAKEVQIVREFRWKEDDSQSGGTWRSSVKYVGGGAGARVNLGDNAMSEREISDFARRMRSRMGGGQRDQRRSAAPPQQRSAVPPPRNAAPPRQAPPPRANGGYHDDRQPPPAAPDDEIPF
jgi:hypothetical protein